MEKILFKDGWRFKLQTGSHRHYTHPVKPGKVTYLYMAEKEGTAIPAPSDLTDIHLDAVAAELEVSAEDTFINLISVDVAAYAKEHFEN